jgi:hypothetical protein
MPKPRAPRRPHPDNTAEVAVVVINKMNLKKLSVYNSNIDKQLLQYLQQD